VTVAPTAATPATPAMRAAISPVVTRTRALLLMLGAALAGCGSSAAPASSGSDADAATASDDGAADAADVPTEMPPPPPPAPYPRPSYVHLSETGLFDDFATKHVAPELLAFEPTHKLWSDAAAKRRWVRLPPGTKIDTSDMDHWVFPVGTKLFKEFSLGGVLLETRLVERYGTGPEDYWMGAFVWNADATDAVLAPDGQNDINGTMHDAPKQKDCGLCHRGDVGRVLGLSAIQMSRATNPPAMPELVAMGLLSNPPADPNGFPAPGDATTAAALGYLHANCGHCHNENGTSWPDTQMVLRLVVADRDAATSGVAQSIVGKDITYWRGGAVKKRVAPGMPDASGVFVRMNARGTMDQMPPLATELVDPTGIELVRQWILGLAP
jgi:hypothetical protein